MNPEQQNEQQRAGLNDLLGMTVNRIVPDYRHLVLEMALELAARHPNDQAQHRVMLRLV